MAFLPAGLLPRANNYTDRVCALLSATVDHQFGSGTWFAVWRCVHLLRLLAALTLQRYLVHPLQSLYRANFLPRELHDRDVEVNRDISMSILHHDAHYLIVNKPHDVNIDRPTNASVDEVTGPCWNGERRPTVASILSRYFPSYYLRNCHQLDYGTSGIYCIALHKKAASVAGKMFMQRLVKKTYTAVVRGHLWCPEEEEEEGADHLIVERSIGKHPQIPMNMAVDGLQAKPARTKVIPLRRGYYGVLPVTLVRLEPLTGRRHQLRLHMASLGHPILGDLDYEEPMVTPCYRMMLHAWEIEFDFRQLNTYVPSKRISANSAWARGLRDRVLSLQSQLPLSKLCIRTENPFLDLVSDQPQLDPNWCLPRQAEMHQRMTRFFWVRDHILPQRVNMAGSSTTAVVCQDNAKDALDRNAKHHIKEE